MDLPTKLEATCPQIASHFELKTCTKCGISKLLTAFYTNKGRRWSSCKACKTARDYQRHRDNPDLQRAFDLRRRFGITLQEYDAMLAAQGGVCAVCGEPPSAKRLAVDHNHTTGKVRALLCYSCNSALGLLNEDRARIQRLDAFLELHGSKH